MGKKPILVTAAIIRKGDKILIAQRKETSIKEANKWEFPGGKVEYEEHPEDCLVREIKEELDMTITVDKLYTVVSHVYPEEFHVILLVFFADYVDGELKCIECQDAKWVDYSDFSKYDFAAPDAPVVKQLLSEFNQ